MKSDFGGGGGREFYIILLLYEVLSLVMFQVPEAVAEGSMTVVLEVAAAEEEAALGKLLRKLFSYFLKC